MVERRLSGDDNFFSFSSGSELYWNISVDVLQFISVVRILERPQCSAGDSSCSRDSGAPLP